MRQSEVYIKNVKVTPKKLRLILPAIKKLEVVQALDRLAYMSKAAARVFHKAIQSAVAAASNALKVTPEELKFKTLLVEEGQKLKRYRAGSRGTAKPFVRKFAHIRIVLEAPEVVTPKLEVSSVKKK